MEIENNGEDENNINLNNIPKLSHEGLLNQISPAKINKIKNNTNERVNENIKDNKDNNDFINEDKQ